MKTRITIPVLFYIVLTLTGCSSDRTKPTQDNLLPPTVSNQIALSEELVINTFKGGSNGLVPGVYAPVAESSEGIFYDGPKDCVWELIDLKRTTYDGGIWWPKNSMSRPRMYWRLSEKQLPQRGPDGRIIGGPLVYWIVQSGLGHANFFPEISDENILKIISPGDSVATKK